LYQNIRSQEGIPDMAAQTTFDPGKYLSVVNGSDYLEVKWRLVWLRHVHPDAHIETDLVTNEDNRAVFKACVTVPDGAVATGWGSEGAFNFPNYIEAAETKAIGRALAALGFGTQFCPDFDFGASENRVVDAPVNLNRVAANTGDTPSNVMTASFSREQSAADQTATSRQMNLIQVIKRELGIEAKALDQLSQEITGRAIDDLSRKEASRLIEVLKDRQGRQAQRSA